MAQFDRLLMSLVVRRVATYMELMTFYDAADILALVQALHESDSAMLSAVQQQKGS